jgi:hypothetical protein
MRYFLSKIINNHYETKAFPEELCTIKDEHDSLISYSSVKFECVILDQDNSEVRILNLYPFTLINDCVDGEYPDEILYGWRTTLSTDSDSLPNAKRGFDRTLNPVIGWRKVG